MQEENVTFFSEGAQLEGTVYLPDTYEPGSRYPAVIPNSGYKGFNRFYPRLFARSLTLQGFVCLGFDYRGFANSGGKPGRVLLDEQVQDIRNALTYLSTRPEVDPTRMAILGWGMGASNVIRVAAQDDRVRAVAALNGFYVGARWLKTVYSYVRWREILQEIAADRETRVTTGQSRRIPPFEHYPLDPLTDQHVNVELAHLPTFDEFVTVEMTESIVEMNAECVVRDIAPRPVFIAHGQGNLLHPLNEAHKLYQAAGEPKQFYEIAGQHNDFMYSDHPEFQRLMEHVSTFFRETL
jgi:fermentation-respiration switch protein FrsA (DUF1100 family)